MWPRHCVVGVVVVAMVVMASLPIAQAQDGSLDLRARQAKALQAATSPERIRRLQMKVQKALDANNVRVTPAIPLQVKDKDGHKMEAAVTIPAVAHPGEDSAYKSIQYLTKIEPNVAKDMGGVMPDVADPMAAKEAVDDVALIKGESGELPSEKKVREVMEAAYKF